MPQRLWGGAAEVCALSADGTNWLLPEQAVESVEFIKPVASYSWDGDYGPGMAPPEKPRIHVPGVARCCKRQAEFVGNDMQEDGEIVKDENHHRLSRTDGGHYPTEPIFVALSNCATSVADVDAICDNSTLRHLLAFLRGKPSTVTVSQRDQGSGAHAPFRFDIDRVGKTMVLTRVEGCDVVPPKIGVSTYGLAFERLVAPLPDGFGMCASFYRVCLMNIGGLRVLVRAQVDAVDGSKIPDTDANVSPGDWEPVPGSALQWKHSGSELALAADVLELKTRSAKARGGTRARDEWYGQMLFRGAKELVLGFHKDGSITRAPTYIPVNDVKKKATATCNVLPALGPLLRRLRSETEAGSVAACCDGTPGAPLRLHRKEDGACRIPAWVLSTWPFTP